MHKEFVGGMLLQYIRALPGGHGCHWNYAPCRKVSVNGFACPLDGLGGWHHYPQTLQLLSYWSHLRIPGMFNIIKQMYTQHFLAILLLLWVARVQLLLPIFSRSTVGAEAGCRCQGWGKILTLVSRSTPTAWVIAGFCSTCPLSGPISVQSSCAVLGEDCHRAMLFWKNRTEWSLLISWV